MIDTDSTLVSAFTTTAKQHIVEIPVVADEVEIYQKNYLRINLTDTYKLPVKGAEYYLTIPKDTVTDAVQNKNNAIENFAITAPGVEPPVIRIQKSKYTIGNPGNTKTPNVDMTKAQTAKMRIDCQTPGATKKYDLKITPSTQKTEDATDHPVTTKTDDPKAPTTASKNYTDNQIITLANEDTYKVDSYNNAKGIKIAILATANDEEKAYEFAARTVLKFRLASHNGDSQNNVIGNLRSRDLQVWVMGGDSPYGGNANSTFPLSWKDPAKFMIMKGGFTSDDMKSTWYLVTWDITSKTYHGFAIGDVPNEAVTKGPDHWIIGENSWTSQKENYPLYPGETLLMDTANSSPTYWFRPTRVISR